MSVVWENPPPSSSGNDPVDVSDILAELMRHPGRWGKVHTGGGSGTSRRAAMLRNAGCVVKTTRAGGGKRTLYAKFPDFAGFGPVRGSE